MNDSKNNLKVSGSFSIRGLSDGIFYPIKALWFIIRHPSVWPWCIVPVIINIAVLYFSWGWLTEFLGSIFGSYFVGNSWWESGLRYVMTFLSFMIRIAAMLVLFIVVGTVAALPFNDFLSEQTDKIANRWADPLPFSIRRTIKALTVTLLQEVKRLSVYVIIITPLFLLSFIPIFAPFTLAIKLIITALFFATDFLSYPLERRGVLLFREKMKFARRYGAVSVGFGLGVTCLAMIPLINFLLFPLAVVGGTLMFGDITRQNADPQISRKPNLS